MKLKKLFGFLLRKAAAIGAEEILNNYNIDFDLDSLSTRVIIPEGREEEAPLNIHTHYLPQGEYFKGPVNKEYLFLHHTAGWHNPYNTIDWWAQDSIGKIATEFVIGGPSIKGNDNSLDGEIVRCIPEGGYAWHLGKNGSRHMHVHSVGIEVCNFGWIKNGKTWAGTTADPSQIVTLSTPFRNYTTFHKYSDTQLHSLQKLILFIANRDNIDVRKGLVEEIHRKGAQAFEYNPQAFNGEVKGMWTHTNTRLDKTDMFPQEELIEMLLNL